MKKIKIIALMLMAALLGLNIVYADEGNTLDVVKAESKIIENSGQMKSAMTMANNATIYYNAIRRNPFNYANTLNSEYQMNYAQRQTNVLQNSLGFAAYSKYIEVLKAKYAYEIQSKSLEQAEEAFNNAKLRYKLNQISSEELAQSENQYNIERLQLQIKHRELQALTTSLNAMMGEEPTKQYTDYIDNNMIPSKEIDTLDAYVASALANRAEILNINDQLAMKNKTIGFTYDYNGNNNPRYTQAKYEIDVLTTQADTTAVDIQLQIYSLYDNLKAAMVALGKAQDAMVEADKNYKSAELKYKMGIISRFDMQGEELSYMQSKYNLKQAELDAWLAQTCMSLASGLGLQI